MSQGIAATRQARAAMATLREEARHHYRKAIADQRGRLAYFVIHRREPRSQLQQRVGISRSFAQRTFAGEARGPFASFRARCNCKCDVVNGFRPLVPPTSTEPATNVPVGVVCEVHIFEHQIGEATDGDQG